MLVHVPRRPGQRVAVIGREGGAFSPLSLSPLTWWRLNDGSGETAVDSSGNGYDLTLSNTPTWIAGHIGGALNFVSTDLERGESSAAGLLAALQSSNTFTVAFWARAAAYQSNAAALAIRNDTETNTLLLIYPYDSANGNGARIFWNGTEIIDQNAGAAAVDTWNHYIFVSRGATDHEMFVNNASVGTSNADKTNSATLSHVTVGTWHGAAQFFSGDMDEILIFDRALTAGEMTQLYQWTG